MWLRPEPPSWSLCTSVPLTTPATKITWNSFRNKLVVQLQAHLQFCVALFLSRRGRRMSAFLATCSDVSGGSWRWTKTQRLLANQSTRSQVYFIVGGKGCQPTSRTSVRFLWGDPRNSSLRGSFDGGFLVIDGDKPGPASRQEKKGWATRL